MMATAQDTPLIAVPPRPMPTKSFSVPVAVPAKPVNPNAKVPREVFLNFHLLEVESGLELPLPEVRLPDGSKAVGTANGGFITQSEGRSVIEFCRTERRGKILAEPSMQLIVGSEGHFRSGSEIQLERPSAQKTTDGKAMPQVNTRFVGTAVDATVTIPKPGLLSVSLVFEQSALSRRKILPDGTPGVVSQRVQTKVDLASGQTFLLRGLRANRTTTTETRMPVLGDLPVVGPTLFSRQRTETETTELMLLVTATALDSDGN